MVDLRRARGIEIVSSLMRIIGKVLFLISLIIIVFFFASSRRVISSPFFFRLFIMAFILAGIGSLAMWVSKGVI